MAQESPTLEQIPETAKKILGGKGKQLHAHEVHMRRAKNGYIAKHDLRDKDGNPPRDGQRPDAEYALPDKAAMLAHMAEHMGSDMEPDEGQGQGEEQGEEKA